MTNPDGTERVMSDDTPITSSPAPPTPPVTVARAAPARAGAKTGRSMTLEGLNAYYGATHAIKDVSLNYARNEVTAMIGPSGCG
jgi:phosphate transport system ATP-binding protein